MRGMRSMHTIYLMWIIGYYSMTWEHLIWVATGINLRRAISAMLVSFLGKYKIAFVDNLHIH